MIKASELQKVFSTCAVLRSLFKVQLWFCSSCRVGTPRLNNHGLMASGGYGQQEQEAKAPASIPAVKQHQVAIRGTAASCKFGCLNSILGVTGRFAEQSFRKHRITLSMFRNPRRMFNTRPYFHGGETSRSSDRRSLHLEICSTSLTGASSCQQLQFAFRGN